MIIINNYQYSNILPIALSVYISIITLSKVSWELDISPLWVTLLITPRMPGFNWEVWPECCQPPPVSIWELIELWPNTNNYDQLWNWFDTFRTFVFSSCCLASNTSQIRPWQHWCDQVLHFSWTRATLRNEEIEKNVIKCL